MGGLWQVETAGEDRLPPRRKWPRWTKTTMRRATCPFCTASITRTIPPAEQTRALAPVRVPIQVPGRAGQLPIPIVLRCTRAVAHRLRIQARIPAGPVQARAEIPARPRQIPTVLCFTPAVTVQRRAAHPPMTPAVGSSKRKRRRMTTPMWQTLPAPPIRTVRT